MNKQEYILITGASSGLGRYFAIHLSQDFNIVLSGRNEEKLLKVKDECSNNNKHLTFKFDLKEVEKLEEEFGSFLVKNEITIKHFIHCAGFMKLLPLKTVSLETINTTFSTNIISAALLVKTLIQRKINSSELKSIIFISSNISNFGAKAFTIYGSSKGAMDSLMRSLAVELAPGIRVNSILPGAIKTEMTQSIFDNKEVEERMSSNYPLGLGEPKDIYEVVKFLISDKARWITGQQFTIDGGRTINISG